MRYTLYICSMKTYGKLSFFLFILLNVVFTAVFVYFIYTGVVKLTLIFLPILNLVLMGYVAYKNYMLVHIDAHELTVEHPFKKQKTSYFFSDIQSVSISYIRDDRNKQQLILTIYKKDNTQDEYIATGMQLERKALIKALSERADML